MSKVLLGNVKGPTGANGADGFSPTVEVVRNTDTEYSLKITSRNGVINTPNLKGANGSEQVETDISKIQSATHYGEITFPDEFPAIPFKFYRDFDGRIKHNYEFDQFKDGYAEIYVNSAAGNDSTGDGSSSKPYASVQKAIEAAEDGSEDSYIIKIVSGNFGSILSRNFASIPVTGTNTITKNISIIGAGSTKTIISTASEQLAWTQDVQGVWKASRSNAYCVFDLETKDVHGEPTPYDNVTTLAECQDQKGTWYTDNSTVWVHTLSGKSPTLPTHIIGIDVALVNLTLINNATLYLENICFIAGRGSNATYFTGDENTQGNLIINNCSFLGGHLRREGSILGNALSAESIKNIYIFNSIASYSGRDGFNYHYTNIPSDRRRECVVVEYDCLAYNNGQYSKHGNNNATSCHEGACIIRIGCIGYNTSGPILDDANGCLSYIVDCHMRDPGYTSENAKAAFYFSNELATEEGKAWLINSGGGGDNYSLNTSEDFEVYLRNFSGRRIPSDLNITILD